MGFSLFLFSCISHIGLWMFFLPEMAFRGRGRGRGRGMGFGRGQSIPRAKEEPFILFPEDVSLPGTWKPPKEEIALITRKISLQRYWESSPYYIRAEAPKLNVQAADIERYSDKPKIQEKRMGTLSSFLNLTAAHFPPELIAGAKRVKHNRKKSRWDLDPDLKKLDMYEKLEGENQGQDPKAVKPKEEEEENEEEVGSEEEEEDSDDGDYNKNIDFDDDEDDLNPDDDGDDEPLYDD
ncbi:uncharacterized protein LOC131258376 [Magnolia sinica]|uniref:uncharacterized protein LOC131258376 n=1 Tax=Magnolia sinica TaxID=86752 RepID=UPI00265ADD73|nr:uncharacterized protein LOC131258376 [Magnolia sinica]